MLCNSRLLEEVRPGTNSSISCLQLGPACLSTDDNTARAADLLGSPAGDRVHWADCNDFVSLEADTALTRVPSLEFEVRKHWKAVRPCMCACVCVCLCVCALVRTCLLRLAALQVWEMLHYIDTTAGKGLM